MRFCSQAMVLVRLQEMVLPRYGLFKLRTPLEEACGKQETCTEMLSPAMPEIDTYLPST